MASLRQIWDHQFRQRAAVKYARVVSRNSDGSYQVSDIATGAERRVSKASPSDEFPIGSWVIVGSPASMRSIRGGVDMILSRAPDEQQGVSANTPTSANTPIEVPAIFSVDPSPIVLVQGGAAVPATIHGAGFLTTGPAYEDAGITDDTAPVLTPPFTIEISIKAGGGVTPGLYDLSVGTATATDAIEVQAPPAVSLEGLWQFDPAVGLERVSYGATAGEGFAHELGPYTPPDSSKEGGLVRLGDSLVFAAGHYLGVITSLTTGSPSYYDIASYAVDRYSQIGVSAAGKILFGDVNGSEKVVEINSDGTGAVEHTVNFAIGSATTNRVAIGVLDDGAGYLWLTYGDQYRRIRKSTGDTLPLPVAGRYNAYGRLVKNSTHVFNGWKGNSRIGKTPIQDVDHPAVTISGALIPADNVDCVALAYWADAGGDKIYALLKDGHVVKVAVSTLNVEATLALGFECFDISLHGSYLYVTGPGGSAKVGLDLSHFDIADVALQNYSY